MQFRGSSGILHVLARYLVIFSLVGHTAIVAEAPHHHIGDLGRLEEVRNILTDAHTLGHKDQAVVGFDPQIPCAAWFVIYHLTTL